MREIVLRIWVAVREPEAPPEPEPSRPIAGWEEAWRRCARRFLAWPTPPRWSALDWRDEMHAVGLAAAWEALRDFDPARGRPLDAFLRGRVRARVLTRYRQEWSYGRRCEPASALADAPADPAAPRAELSDLLAPLPESDRRLLVLLLLDGRTEAEVAEEFRISQPAVSKRKASILRRLRRALANQSESEG